MAALTTSESFYAHHVQQQWQGQNTGGVAGGMGAQEMHPPYALSGHPSTVMGHHAVYGGEGQGLFEAAAVSALGGHPYNVGAVASSTANSSHEIDLYSSSASSSMATNQLYPSFFPIDQSALMQQQQQHVMMQQQIHLLPNSCSQAASLASIPSTSFVPFGIQQHPPQSIPHQHTSSLSAGSSIHHHPSSSSTTASASDSCSQIAHVLMCYQQGGEEPEFVRKAIESLVKKLKDKRVELEALITAVTSAGKQPTGCVTIQRSLDGRLQVAGRKGVPHVVYARIWRWPNVGKNELQKLSLCCVAPDNQDYICINPYHYERVVSNAVGPIDINPVRMDTQSFSMAGSANGGYGGGAGDEMAKEEQWPMNRVTAAALQTEMRSVADAFRPQGTLLGNANASAMARFHKFDLSRVQVPVPALFPEDWCTVTYYELDTQIGDSFKARRELSEIVVDGGMDPQADRHGRICLGALPNVHRSAASEKARMHIGTGVLLRHCSDGTVTIEVRSLKPIFIRAPFLDFSKKTPYGAHVLRLTNEDGPVTIFDLRWAYAEMFEQTQMAKEVAEAQARAISGLPVAHPGMQIVAHDAVAGSGVDEMKRIFCSVGLSFVKGWGAGYPRHSIKDCPCWIEVQLHRPLQVLDQLLKGNMI